MRWPQAQTDEIALKPEVAYQKTLQSNFWEFSKRLKSHVGIRRALALSTQSSVAVFNRR